MRKLLFLIVLMTSPLAGRDDANGNNLYDRSRDKLEQEMIVYYNRWFKFRRQHPECACPCPQEQPCCPYEYCPTPEERAYRFQD